MITKITDKILFEGDEDKVAKGRYRAFFVRTYAPLDALRDVFAYAEKYAYILHDSDVNADGTPKAPHSHFIVRYRDNLTPSAFAKKMSQIAPNEQTYFSPLGDKYTAIDYMLHRDSKSLLAEKHRYPTSAILTEDIDYFLKSEKEQKEAKNKQFFDDLFEGKLTRKEMAYKYGRDYAKNMYHYDNFAKEVYYEEYAKEVVEETKNASADWLDICFTVVKKAIHPYVAQSNTMPSDKFLYDQIARLFEDQIISRTNKGEITK